MPSLIRPSIPYKTIPCRTINLWSRSVQASIQAPNQEPYSIKRRVRRVDYTKHTPWDPTLLTPPPPPQKTWLSLSPNDWLGGFGWVATGSSFGWKKLIIWLNLCSISVRITFLSLLSHFCHIPVTLCRWLLNQTKSGLVLHKVISSQPRLGQKTKCARLTLTLFWLSTVANNINVTEMWPRLAKRAPRKKPPKVVDLSIDWYIDWLIDWVVDRLIDW